MPESLLIRYGLIADVAKFVIAEESSPGRGEQVVVRTKRGVELGTVLERVRTAASGSTNPGNGANGHDELPSESNPPQVLRAATTDDLQRAELLRSEAQSLFAEWTRKIERWGLELELIDLEWTIDREKLILYVLAGRGPESTKLALYAAAEGTSIEVQPVTAEGLATLPAAGGGCGSGGCGCH